MANEVPESEWRDNFRMSERSFYELKNYTHVFGVSHASISSTVRRVSHAVANFLGPQLIKLPKTARWK